MAGVLLFEKYKNEFALIIFKQKSGKFSDAGGGQDLNETKKRTACRELREESRNLFIINENVLDDKISVVNRSYVGYLLYITSTTGIRSKHYYENMKVLIHNNARKEWQETTEMSRVYIKDLTAALSLMEDLNTVDVYGKAIVIDARTKALIAKAFQNKFLFLSLDGIYKISSIIPQVQIIDNRKSKKYATRAFLNGTYSYYHV